MRIFNLLIVSLIIITFTSGCSVSRVISYQVSTRVDPFLKVKIDSNYRSSFSFLHDSTNNDPVIEKQIHFIIMSGLKDKGWIYDDSGKGEIIIFVKYTKETRQQSYVQMFKKPKKNTKDPDDYQYVATTNDVYVRKVSIYASYQNNIKDVIWSADCESTGSSNDLMIAAKPMVKFATEKFLQEGLWEKTSKTE